MEKLKLFERFFVAQILLVSSFCRSDSDFDRMVERFVRIDEKLNRLQQDDPALIEAVSQLLIWPEDPTAPYNFSVLNPRLEGQYLQGPI
jgi:hypothetical protein